MMKAFLYYCIFTCAFNRISINDVRKISSCKTYSTSSQREKRRTELEDLREEQRPEEMKLERC